MADIVKSKLEGIHSYKGIPQLKITEYRHPAWTTVVYGIPRGAITAKINKAELNSNSIYILQDNGSNGKINALYVGHAAIRNSGESVLKRLKEHTTDQLRDKWDYAYVFTSVFQDENGWNPTIISILENYFARYIEDNANCECLNGNTPNIGSKVGPELDEIKSNIETYIYFLMGDAFDKDIEDESNIEKKEISIQVNDLQSDVFGTRDITTPEDTVRRMVDLLPEKLFNRDTRFLDLACKAGEYLQEIYTRLMECDDLKLAYEEPAKRSMHILENQLFGIAISENSYNTTTELLYGDHKRRNIRRLKGYEYIIKDSFSNGYKQGVAKSRDLILNTIFSDIERKIDKETGQEKYMQFDVVIGNPPYNDDETRGGVGSGNSLYMEFAIIASELATYSSLIMPSGWMLQYPIGTKHELVDEFRKNKHIAELHDYADSYKIFRGVGIKAGVCYYLLDNTKEYETCKHEVITEKGEVYTIDNIPLYNEDAEVCFRDKYVLSISSKIKNMGGQHKFRSFADTCAGAKHYFDDGSKVLTSVWDEYSSYKTDEYNIQYFLKSNNKVHKYTCTNIPDCGMPNLGYAWVTKDQIPRNVDDYKRHKVLMGQICNDNYRVMDVPYYAGNNSCCSQSYIPIFSPNNTEEECLNICKYIKTQFFRYLVSVLKIGQNLGNRVYKLVPTQDFTNNSDIDWSQSITNIDQQLYKKYNLTQEEIDYIERTIKPME